MPGVKKRVLEGARDFLRVKRQRMERCESVQCGALLKKLMVHPSGWVFNQQVDHVKLGIPDYFHIITKPMDLGTVKSKLEGFLYSSIQEFAADVRLTFDNAMRYNPPYNNVHKMAEELLGVFEIEWKAIDHNRSKVREVKVPSETTKEIDEVGRKVFQGKCNPKESNAVEEKIFGEPRKKINEPNSLLRKTSKKLKICGGKDIRMLSEGREVKGLRKEASETKSSLPKEGKKLKLCSQNSVRSPSEGKVIRSWFDARDAEGKVAKSAQNSEQNVERPNANIFNGLEKEANEATNLMLKISNKLKPSTGKVLRRCSEAKATEGKFGKSVHNLKQNLERPNLEKAQVSRHGPNTLFSKASKKVRPLGGKDIRKSSEGKLVKRSFNARVMEGEATKPVQNNEDNSSKTTLPEGALSCSNDKDRISGTELATLETDTATDDEWRSSDCDVQLSPKEALRVTMLKSRFLDTILKAQETLFNHGAKSDPVKIQEEKERLEKKHRQEKARIEARIRAEAASRKQTEIELKKQREKEREAARISLQKMEATAQIEQNLEVQKELEKLCGCSMSYRLVGRKKCKGEEIWSPLEKLGLFLKDDYWEDEDE